MDIVILLQLLLAHILTDFVFQPYTWVESKNTYGLKSNKYWFHILIAGLTTYIILHQWSNWKIPILVMITHALIDYWKISKESELNKYNDQISNDKNKKNGTKYFFIDQFLHIAVILIAWLWLIRGFDQILPLLNNLFTDKNKITIITSLVFIIWPLGLIIGKLTEPFRAQLDTGDSLKNAGRYIGISERILVFIFIMINQYAAIGFLIASKSILRISKDKDGDARKQTEYVLIGTLISFTSAIIIGLLVKYILRIG